MPEPSNPANRKTVDPKRGANRSTKVAGKLKVLPEQPEHLPILGAKPLKERVESGGTTGDSDEGDIEENDDESQEYDVEVRGIVDLAEG